jgi:hypothetical protein
MIYPLAPEQSPDPGAPETQWLQKNRYSIMNA